MKMAVGTHSKSFLTFVALLAIPLCCGWARGQKQYAQPAKIGGQIRWIVREAATGKIIDNGTMTIHVQDVSVKRRRTSSKDERPFFRKRFALNKDFYLGMSGFPETNLADLVGFGLVVEHRNLKTFCWEWFNVDREKHAIKIQETGELAFDAKKIGSGWQITRTDFLTDVTFRVMLLKTNKHETDSKWRVTVMKGSYVNWPSLR
jgi:hypothetical protein